MTRIAAIIIVCMVGYLINRTVAAPGSNETETSFFDFSSWNFSPFSAGEKDKVTSKSPSKLSEHETPALVTTVRTTTDPTTSPTSASTTQKFVSTTRKSKKRTTESTTSASSPSTTLATKTTTTLGPKSEVVLTDAASSAVQGDDVFSSKKSTGEESTTRPSEQPSTTEKMPVTTYTTTTEATTETPQVITTNSVSSTTASTAEAVTVLTVIHEMATKPPSIIATDPDIAEQKSTAPSIPDDPEDKRQSTLYGRALSHHVETWIAVVDLFQNRLTYQLFHHFQNISDSIMWKLHEEDHSFCMDEKPWNVNRTNTKRNETLARCKVLKDEREKLLDHLKLLDRLREVQDKAEKARAAGQEYLLAFNELFSTASGNYTHPLDRPRGQKGCDCQTSTTASTSTGSVPVSDLKDSQASNEAKDDPSSTLRNKSNEEILAESNKNLTKSSLEKLSTAVKSKNFTGVFRTTRVLQRMGMKSHDLHMHQFFHDLPDVAKYAVGHKFLQIQKRHGNITYVLIAENGTAGTITLDKFHDQDENIKKSSEWRIVYDAGERSASLINRYHRLEMCAQVGSTEEQSQQDSDYPLNGSIILKSGDVSPSCKWYVEIVCNRKNESSNVVEDAPAEIANEIDQVEQNCGISFQNMASPDSRLKIDRFGDVILETYAPGFVGYSAEVEIVPPVKAYQNPK